MSDLEDRIMEITQSEQQTERQTKTKTKQHTRSMVQHKKCQHSHYRGSRRKKRIKNLFKEIMAKNFTNLNKETDTLIQESQRVPSKKNPNRLTPRHNIIKTAEVRDRILKAAREK